MTTEQDKKQQDINVDQLAADVASVMQAIQATKRWPVVGKVIQSILVAVGAVLVSKETVNQFLGNVVSIDEFAVLRGEFTTLRNEISGHSTRIEKIETAFEHVQTQLASFSVTLESSKITLDQIKVRQEEKSSEDRANTFCDYVRDEFLMKVAECRGRCVPVKSQQYEECNTRRTRILNRMQ